MIFKFQKHLCVCLAAGGCLLLLGGLLPAALNQSGTITVSEECIRCHANTYNQGIENRQVHMPFWEKQCSSCHLSEGSSWSSAESSRQFITGIPVEQSPLWRKQQIFRGTSRGLEQQVMLPGLESETSYRFRIRVADKNSQSLAESLWLGLKTVEILEGEKSRKIIVTEGLGSDSGNRIDAITLNIIAADMVNISWKIAQPHDSWLELQTLTDSEANTMLSGEEKSSQSVHPSLRNPVEQAINACYQCHPESTLGTSHPVRLYGGKDVQIPDELPTVDGMLTCVTCHNPHGSEGEMLVREMIKTKLCVTCHYKFKNSSPSTMFQ